MKSRIVNKKTVIIATLLCLVMTIGGISAYFTSTDNATNTFTIGNVTIDLTEPEYDDTPEDREDITPDKEITKDPTITNTGTNDAFVFAEFSMPKANITVANADGSKGTKAVQELFEYTVADGWVLVESDKSAATYNTYVYAYGDNTSCTALAKDKSAPVLFKDSKIKFKNVIEGEGLENTTVEIPVKAYGIQINDLGTTSPSGVWAILSNQAK